MPKLSIQLKKPIIPIILEFILSFFFLFLIFFFSYNIEIFCDNYPNIIRTCFNFIVLGVLILFNLFFFKSFFYDLIDALDTIIIEIKISNKNIYIYEIIEDYSVLINHFDASNLYDFSFEEIFYKDNSLFRRPQYKLILNGHTKHGKNISHIIFNSILFKYIIDKKNFYLIKPFLEKNI